MVLMATSVGSALSCDYSSLRLPSRSDRSPVPSPHSACPRTYPCENRNMRYLVRGRVKPGREQALCEAIERGTLGAGSIAGDEYLRNMRDARLFADGTARW